MGQLELWPKDHAVAVGFSLGGNFIPFEIDDRVAIFVANLFSFVAAIEIELAVRAEDKSVNAVVMLNASNASEEKFLGGRFAGAVVGENKNIRRIRNNDLVPEHADS